MSVTSDATVVTELTPPGRAAVAVVVVAGPNALAAVQRFFSPVTPWHAGGPPIGRIMLGRWGGEHVEELVVCRRGVDQFEIHCHGGAVAAPTIVEQLVAAGCERLSWREWVRLPRSRVSPIEDSPCRTRQSESRRDSATWAAVAALAEATTVRTAAVLLDQYHGALSSAVEAARVALAASDALRASEVIDGILQYRELGPHLTTPWRVVIAGPPNVGKSSLINAIAGYQRAIVSPQPGTTRDVVTLTTAINGWPVQFADTAGLRETRDELESEGVALAGAALEQADLAIVVSDATAEFYDAKEILDRLAPPLRVIRAVNKIDLVDGGEDASPGRVPSNPAHFASQAECRDTRFVSALTGQGIAELLAAIERLLVPLVPPAGAAVAFTTAQIAGLEAARGAIDKSNLRAADAALAAMLSIGDDANCT